MTNAPTITGATRLYAIVGDPIAQVRSPEVFTARFAATGVDAVMVPVHVPVAAFDAIVPSLLAIGNLDGVLVTVPFKARMLRFAARLGETAKCIGALNALRRDADGAWTGDMFDGAGFVRGAQSKGERLEGRRVALFGAGGAGSAIACALAEAGVASVAVVDPAPGRAGALTDRLRAAFPACRFEVAWTAPADADLVVNASPVGMAQGDGLPAQLGALAPTTLVGDVVVSDAPTAMIRHATQCGCRSVNGRDMHAGQVDAILSFLLPHGSRPR